MGEQVQAQLSVYMAALEGLSATGLLLVDQLKQAGRLVREKDEQMRLEGGVVARRLEAELRQVKDHHTSVLLAIVESMPTTVPEAAGPLQEQLLSAFLEEANAQKAAIAAKRCELEGLREAPPGYAERQQAIDAFNNTLDQLTAECDAASERLGRRMRVPWQLQQCAAINADDPHSVVPLEGGRILDAEGNNVWGSECFSCGWEIQDGAKVQQAAAIERVFDQEG